jgi:hypothetical protein
LDNISLRFDLGSWWYVLIIKSGFTVPSTLTTSLSGPLFPRVVSYTPSSTRCTLQISPHILQHHLLTTPAFIPLNLIPKIHPTFAKPPIQVLPVEGEGEWVQEHSCHLNPSPWATTSCFL